MRKPIKIECIGILGQVWYLIVSIPDLCNLITLTFIDVYLVVVQLRFNSFQFPFPLSLQNRIKYLPRPFHS